MTSSLDSLNSWYADWKGLRVAVLGLGKTGFSVADTLTELGAEVLVLAESAEGDLARLVPVIGASLHTGDLSVVPEALTAHNADVLVVSPGFRPDHPLVRWAAENAVPVWGDIELAWRVRDKSGTPAEWILVTGTNGKTTTTQLTASMIAAQGLRVAPCGNIGVPVLDAVRDPGGFDFFVVELSSFQLHYLAVQTGSSPISPISSVCLNIADDHLDWHGGLAGYIAAKGFVYENVSNACVYNKADVVTEEMVRAADVRDGARAIGFDLGVPGPSDVGVVEGILVDRAFHEDRHHSALELATVADLAERGLGAPHIVEDILAASALARSVGITPESIAEALANFRADAHRVESVLTAGGIHWVDDSKATNAHAARASLGAFPSVVWIVGGLLKGAHLDDLIVEFAPRLRGVVLIGAERGELRDAFARHAPEVAVVEVTATETGDVMTHAVELAAGFATEGDTVLLAPAAASMDQFVSYSDRGQRFATAVRDQWGGPANGLPSEHVEG
ncbi:UDP-N-acetylmuramoyl-L-alanine--D-glutamate ligase [Mycetocola tolaasinivorans]|uniref:UDP-N-acetylmuramoylalanine--D-glutamate ligase n=1 Tax=Mycetocola tolaasinivorans TaxID=76635 RepID=A0A3L7ADL2_9MICO|nr:UDP-N-acetylmuramoyl-L-alanine--D-glutamate ligase [Mycetocola tolaasinivorans]RLP78064.1 UDP-N-acetylmuramoyl-L-alanine--D-glutamate ligase [Mycetocola tolaasinivorans]